LAHLAFVTLTTPWADARARVVEYVRVECAIAGFEREWAQRYEDRLASAIAVAALRLGCHAEEAVRILERFLPRPPRWLADEDKQDQRQQLWEKLIEQATALPGDPISLLGRVCEADPALVYLPNAARGLFLNGLRAGRLDAMAHLHVEEDGAGPGADPGESGGDPQELALSEQPTQDRGLLVQEFVRRLERSALTRFRHTPLQRQLLRVLLTGDLEEQSPTVLAERAGCSREAASRYLSKLDRHRAAILKALEACVLGPASEVDHTSGPFP
jgi:hypothetical protein